MTCVDVVKKVLYMDATVADYANYNIKPNLIIFARDDIGTIPPGGAGAIFIKDFSQQYIVAANGKHLFSRSYCECVMAETTSALRDTFFDDIKTLLEAASYSLIIKNLRRDDRRNLFINIFEIHLVN